MVGPATGGSTQGRRTPAIPASTTANQVLGQAVHNQSAAFIAKFQSKQIPVYHTWVLGQQAVQHLVPLRLATRYVCFAHALRQAPLRGQVHDLGLAPANG